MERTIEKRLMRLSVIIPVYNAGRYIGACLQSLYRQGLEEEDFEVIVVDDGSRDDSLIQVGRLAAFHSNIQIMAQKNQGVSAARNNGMKKAKGTYIYFMDADDYLMDAIRGGEGGVGRSGSGRPFFAGFPPV